MNSGYQWILRKTLLVPLFRVPLTKGRSATVDSRLIVMLVFFVVLGGMVYVFKQLKSELSPMEDRGLFLAFVIAPEGSTMQYTDALHARGRGNHQGHSGDRQLCSRWSRPGSTGRIR